MTETVPASRGEAATLLLDVLAVACPDGEARLIGSMAKPGAADVLSDIDIRCDVPAVQAAGQLQSLRTTLQRVGTVESLRVDPDAGPDVCLVFARFQDWPLWWRVDLEVHATGAGSMRVRDADAWSPEESACMGVVVVLKALVRKRLEVADIAMARSLRRVEATDVAGDWQLRIGSLLEHIVTRSPATADLVARARQLSREVFDDGATASGG